MNLNQYLKKLPKLYDKTFKNNELCLEIFSSLPPEYEKVALLIRPGAEWNTIIPDQYFGKLEAYELEGIINVTSKPSMHKTLALSATEPNLKV